MEVSIPGPLDNFGAFFGYVAAWYVFAAGVVRVLLLTDAFDDLPGTRGRHRGERAVATWVLSPLVLPGAAIFPFAWTGLWILSLGVVPAPWRCIQPLRWAGPNQSNA